MNNNNDINTTILKGEIVNIRPLAKTKTDNRSVLNLKLRTVNESRGCFHNISIWDNMAIKHANLLIGQRISLVGSISTYKKYDNVTHQEIKVKELTIV